MLDPETQNVILIVIVIILAVSSIFKKSGIVINNNLKYHYAENLDELNADSEE